MLITVEATYESGVLKLHEPLPLDEHETVRVTVQTDKAGPAHRTGPDVCIDRPAEPSAMGANGDTAPPAEEFRDFGEGEMIDIRLNVPPSPAARTVIAHRGPLPLPDPPVIPPDDDEIE